MSTLQDRRITERWNFLKPTYVKIEQLNDDLFQSMNFSDHGFKIISSKDLPSGSFINLLIIFDDQKQIDLRARLIWKKTLEENSVYEFGMMLIKTKNYEEYKETLSNYSKTSIPERRELERRSFQSETTHEKRAHGRRGIPNIIRRSESTVRSLDRWASFNTYGRIIESASESNLIRNNKHKINLGSNNYLGLTYHPKVKEAATKAIEKYGAGAGGVRLLSGTMDLHKILEEKLAKFKGTESCLVVPSGYIANIALLTTIGKKGDVLINDRLNHASIIDGCFSTDAKIEFYKHSDMDHLENKLKRHEHDRPKLIITDGVFSMDGDVAPLPEILKLAKQYNASVVVDDAHATGVIGKQGRGTSEHHQVLGKTDIVIATLSKALGGVGGAICGPSSVIKSIAYGKYFMFTTAIPPSICASVIAGLDVINNEPQLIQNLHKNRISISNQLKKMGYQVMNSESAIVPIVIGDEITTYKLTMLLEDMNVFVSSVSRPAVPRKLARIRLSVMATHTTAEIDEAVHAFEKAGKKLGII